MTGLAVSSAVALGVDRAPADAAALSAAAPFASAPAPGADGRPSTPYVGSRDAEASRSDARTGGHAVKRAARDRDPSRARKANKAPAPRDPRTVARALLPRFGFGADEFPCLDALYVSESGWDVHADNPSSSAYGIPQALPGEKMASAGADWEDNAATQIEWGLGYIKTRYGTPCAAWSFKQGNNWY